MSAPKPDKRGIEVVWEAPPEQVAGTLYDDALATVKASPGRWARVRVVDKQGTMNTSASSIRKRVGDDPRWEIKGGRLPDDPDRFGIWARYRTDEQMSADGGVPATTKRRGRPRKS